MVLLFEALSGSRLYGTARLDSDVDTRGVFAETRTELFGFGREETRTESGGEDKAFYSLHKYVSLALKGNPNILEMAFTPEKHWLHTSDMWYQFFRNNRKLLSRRCIAPYLGYAQSQLKRIKAGKSPQEEKRRSLIEKYGFDVKDASHTLRLLFQLQGILEEGILYPTLSGSQLAYIRAVLEGEKTIAEIEDCAENWTRDIRELEKTTQLPEEPDVAFFHNLVITYYTENLHGVLY